MLQRMFTERLITAADAAAFSELLPAHQRAVDAESVPLIDRAVLEHNVFATSRVYANITFASLGALLGVGPARAEKVAARMVVEGRLAATIDQVDGVLEFAQEGARAAPDAAVASLLNVSSTVKDVCLSFNAVVDAISELK